MAEGVTKLPNSKVLFSLADLSERTNKKLASIKGEYGERIAHHQENSNLHLQAFKLVAKLDQMDELKRQTFLEHFDAYVDAFEKERWAQEGHTGNLLETSEADADEAEQEAAAKRNAKALTNGISKLPDSEAEKDAAAGGAGKKKPGQKPASVKGMPSAQIN